MMVELVAAVVVIAIAIMALMAGYSAAFLSLHKASQKSSAATLADNQIELYTALAYTSVGLDTTTLSSVKASNTTYTTDEASLDNAGTAVDHTFACGSASQCLPVQTLTGSDSRSYSVETFIRDVPNLAYTGRNERVVSIIVRDPSSTGSPIVARMSTAFDSGP